MRKLSIIFSIALAATGGLCQAAWTSFHGNADNTGFARVDTAPADITNQVGLVDVGPVAPGANPVTAPDGTVYVGNLRGELIALRPDGAFFWKQNLRQSIFASPAIGADGSIYVISGNQVRVRDQVYDSDRIVDLWYLHKFMPGGAELYRAAFPMSLGIGSLTSAPPSIWNFSGKEVVMVPTYASFDISLTAFDAGNGSILDDEIVTRLDATIHGSGFSFDDIGNFFKDIAECITHPVPSECGTSFSESSHLDGIPVPMPGVAIRATTDGSPLVWLADGVRSTVAFRFDPLTGFEKIFRSDDRKDRKSTAPMALKNDVALVGTGDGQVRFEQGAGAFPGFGTIRATPTRMADGRLVVINTAGTMSVLIGATDSMTVQLNGGTIASAAASCTHLYVSTTNEFVSFDVKTMQRVATHEWTGDGYYPPIIGPLGHVYALTHLGLNVFAPPVNFRRGPAQFKATTACDGLISNPLKKVLVP